MKKEYKKPIYVRISKAEYNRLLRESLGLGSILHSNDKLFTGFNKNRPVVITVWNDNKKGVSRILSLENKDSKINTTLKSIKQYPSIPKPSGVDYRIYYKTLRGDDLNFGSMKITGDKLDSEDLENVSNHVKKRGGQRLNNSNKKYSRK